MNQREIISNKFSDAYLLALIEGGYAKDVLAEFSKEYPELATQFEANAQSLDMMYGYIPSDKKATDAEIATAYKKVSQKLPPIVTTKNVAVQPGLISKIKSFFSTSPMWAGASLGMGVAVLIALLWQPWTIKESKEMAHHGEKNEEAVSEKSEEIASNTSQTSSDPMKTPEVTYRGKNTKPLLSAAQQKQQDSIDEARLKKMAAPKPLSAPEDIRIEPVSAGQILISWSPSSDALSYIVEMKSENDDTFDAVTQIGQTKARVTSLESGKKYFVRIIATSGERKGPPSDAKSIIVP
jgi:hypothetical protein